MKKTLSLNPGLRYNFQYEEGSMTCKWSLPWDLCSDFEISVGLSWKQELSVMIFLYLPAKAVLSNHTTMFYLGMLPHDWPISSLDGKNRFEIITALSSVILRNSITLYVCIKKLINCSTILRRSSGVLWTFYTAEGRHRSSAWGHHSSSPLSALGPAVSLYCWKPACSLQCFQSFQSWLVFVQNLQAVPVFRTIFQGVFWTT